MALVCAAVLDFLEQTALAENVNWDVNPGFGVTMSLPGQAAVMTAQISTFHCPSDSYTETIWNPNNTCISRAPPQQQYGRISYAANLGRGQMEAKDGPQAGSYRVRIHAERKTGRTIQDYQRGPVEERQTVQSREAETLTADVQAGSPNTFEFALHQDGPPN